MTIPAPITTALEVAEAGILAALNALAPIGMADWDVAPVGTVGQLLQLPAATSYRSRVYVAQHQDGGGMQDNRLASAGWSGLVVVRCLSARADYAALGMALIVTALATLTAPAGYALHAQYDRPIAIPVVDTIATRAGQYRVTIRRWSPAP